MRLTIKNRLKLCFEILTTTSGHGHPTDEKQISIFQRGYAAGLRDGKHEYNELLYAVANKFPGESRHETALRYIRNAERVDNAPEKCSA